MFFGSERRGGNSGVHVWTGLLGCSSEGPHTRRLKATGLYSLTVGVWKSKIKVSAGHGPCAAGRVEAFLASSWLLPCPQLSASLRSEMRHSDSCLCRHVASPMCLSSHGLLFPGPLLFLEGRWWYWFHSPPCCSAALSSLKQLQLQWSSFQIRSQSQELEVRTSTFLFGGARFNL